VERLRAGCVTDDSEGHVTTLDPGSESALMGLDGKGRLLV
jgi:hypothetical protein